MFPGPTHKLTPGRLLMDEISCSKHQMVDESTSHMQCVMFGMFASTSTGMFASTNTNNRTLH